MNLFTKGSQYLLLSLLLVLTVSLKEFPAQQPFQKHSSGTLSIDSIYLADPTIFYSNGIYYLYGTGGRDGFLVYTSSDRKSWKGPAGAKDGYALLKGDAFGTSGFWAPQVFEKAGTFYMAYTANENIAIAKSNSPLGPFRQDSIRPISGTGKQIDPFVFIDDDGTKYLYHVRLREGNRIYVAKMKDDFSDIQPETLQECISATAPWENTDSARWPVTEGPTVLKHKNRYYLFYSANDFRNIHYAVGYAVATTPYGPWKKYSGNPIISRNNIGHNGTGHGDFIEDKKGDLYYVFHTHRSTEVVSPRLTAIVKALFVKDDSGIDRMEIAPGSFHYLSLSHMAK